MKFYVQGMGRPWNNAGAVFLKKLRDLKKEGYDYVAWEDRTSEAQESSSKFKDKDKARNRKVGHTDFICIAPLGP